MRAPAFHLASLIIPLTRVFSSPKIWPHCFLCFPREDLVVHFLTIRTPTLSLRNTQQGNTEKHRLEWPLTPRGRTGTARSIPEARHGNRWLRTAQRTHVYFYSQKVPNVASVRAGLSITHHSHHLSIFRTLRGTETVCFTCGPYRGGELEPRSQRVFGRACLPMSMSSLSMEQCVSTVMLLSEILCRQISSSEIERKIIYQSFLFFFFLNMSQFHH